MDLNYLLEREQVERVLAQAAGSAEARAAHGQLAALYRSRIDAYRHGGRQGGSDVAAPVMQAGTSARSA